ncbi:MAG: hypothetical protein LBN71_06240 [Tannerella sp.]|nr:hypothetical protein [Tannerella sp.]
MKTVSKIIISVLLFSIGLSSCEDEHNPESNVLPSAEKNQILLLKVDYTTNVFEGGNELTPEKQANTFTISTEYKEPGDFGNIKLYYSEINELIFDGDIIWMGKGAIHFPENWWNETNDNKFKQVGTKDYHLPKNGFEQIFDDGHITDYKAFDETADDINSAWSAIQGLRIVRDYLQANPEEKVKVYFYQPSVGTGDPADWKWIFILKRGGGIFNTAVDILFEHYYINHAWGYQHAGYFIDKNGQIWVYEEKNVNYYTSAWNFPDNNGYITARALNENLSQTTISQTRIDVSELKKYANLISQVKENDFTERNQGADMGASINVCYLYNETTKTYKRIVLSENGDWIRTNNSPAAKTIDKWLETIEVKNN